MRDDERFWAAAAHLAAAIPLWGVVADATIWLSFKEKSRDIVFHAQQAIFFQTAVLAIGLAWAAIGILQKIVTIISPGMGSVLAVANNSFLTLWLLFYAAVCVYGAIMTWTRGQFLYPVIGARLAEGFRRQAG